MQRKDIKEALERVSSGNYSAEDEAIAKYWIHQSHQDDEVQLSKEEWLEVKHKIWADLESSKLIKQPVIKPLWPKIAVVAAAVAIIVMGVYFFNAPHTTEPVAEDQYANDVAPGKVGATLTLSNGKKIRLGNAVNGEIAKQAGIKVTKTANGQLVYEIASTASGDNNDPSTSGANQSNTLTTAKGETYILILPDKSKVWMNAATSLTYSASLNERGIRRVRLSGEAYFKVAKDKAHPFVVESGTQQVEVLGTHFNVNAYADESAVKTTLLEGRVKVMSFVTNSKPVILKPNQQSLVSGTNQVAVQDVDPEEAVAWRNGEFLFAGDDFRTIMRKIARWYDVDVIYQTNPPADFELGGVVSRLKNVSVVLKRMEETAGVHFRIEGRRIYVIK
jgi:transmembrane sensor